MSGQIHFKQTQYGFEYGAAKITRIHSDEKTGRVWMDLATPKYKRPIQIHVTKTGKVRVFTDDGEMVVEDKE